MCAVSVMSDWGREHWNPFHLAPQDSQPTLNPETVIITRQQWDEYLKLLDAARKFDEATGQPDCGDSQKMEWMKKVEDRLNQLEAV